MVYKKDARAVSTAIEALGESWTDFQPLADKLTADGTATVDSFTVTSDMLTWEKKSKTVHEQKYVPSVIEPSFGIGRILYSLLEHSFDYRENDEKRIFMRFNPCVAPVKCAVLPLSNTEPLPKLADKIATGLTAAGLSCKTDSSGASLGKRYARMDEIGVPFCVTVDFESVTANTATMRDRDSMVQIRLPIGDIEQVVEGLVSGKRVFEELKKVYVVVTVDEGEGEGEGEGKVAAVAAVKLTKVEVTPRGRFSRPA